MCNLPFMHFYSPFDGLYCDSQCGRFVLMIYIQLAVTYAKNALFPSSLISFFYQCWGGIKGPLQAVAPGTRCYGTKAGALDPDMTSSLAYSSAVLVHENDVHCLSNTQCDPFGTDTVLRCYFSQIESSVPTSICGKAQNCRPIVFLSLRSDVYHSPIFTHPCTRIFCSFSRSFKLLSLLCRSAFPSSRCSSWNGVYQRHDCSRQRR